MSKDSRYTKLQFKFDMGLGDNGKTKVVSKTYDNLKNDFSNTSALTELGELMFEAYLLFSQVNTY